MEVQHSDWQVLRGEQGGIGAIWSAGTWHLGDVSVVPLELFRGVMGVTVQADVRHAASTSGVVWGAGKLVGLSMVWGMVRERHKGGG